MLFDISPRAALHRAIAASALAACAGGDPTPGPEASAASVVATESAGVPSPPDNPSSPQKVALGRLLFWDPILSGSRDVACASCHDPALGYTDGRAIAIGTGGERAARNALTILDAAWNGWTAGTPEPDPVRAPMFWDNRVESLEAQARGPISAAHEMRGPTFTDAEIFPEIVRRLEAIPAYVNAFAAAFGSKPIDAASTVRAIAAFERTLVTVPSYQKWLAGDDAAMSAAAKRGVDAFRRSGCSRCHSGPMLSDFTLHRFTRGGEAIRTPSLRNVARTAPYMHDGRAPTIDDVFEIYRRVDANDDPLFENLRVPDDRDRADVVAFLHAASDGDYDASVPTSVPSGLSVGGTRATGN